MNILLTCSGRRDYLVKYFQEALDGKGLVFAADSSPAAPSLYDADKAFIVPRIDAPDYIKTLIEICRENNIKALISLNDLELPILSANIEKFKNIGVFPVVSSSDVIDICFDKWQTIEFARAIGINCPKTFLTLESASIAIQNGELFFPLVIKPRWGSASIGIEYVEDEEELHHAYCLAKKKLSRTILANAGITNEPPLMIQEKLNGIEYGLDILNNLRGELACVFVKKKIAMRAGETDKAITIHDPELETLGEKIGSGLKHIGNLDCDIFHNDGGFYLLEMNPRFGGGYPFSHVAGANIPATIIAWLRGKEPEPSFLKIEPDILSAKCDRIVICNISDIS